jgi:signal peptidase I
MIANLTEGKKLDLKKIWRNDYFKLIMILAVILIVVAGSFFGLQLALNTSSPMLVVDSGSMCIPYGSYCDGWSHPFNRTLHEGDIIIIQGVDAKDLNTNYPYSDIIVYRNPANPSATPIVHRIVSSEEVNGTLYFQTKGDGNDTPWPAVPSSEEYDSNRFWRTGQGVPQDLVVGRVVMRIPWFGWITLIMKRNPLGYPVVVVLILLLVIVEFILPLVKARKRKVKDDGKNLLDNYVCLSRLC